MKGLDELNRWSAPIVANILWAILTLLVLTSPLAVVGLFAVMFRWMDDKDTPVFSVFFGTIRRVWLKSYIIFLIDILIGGVIYLNLVLFQFMDMGNVIAYLSRSVTIFAALTLLLVNIYTLTLLSIWDKPLKAILKFSLQLIFAQPIWSILIGVGTIAPFIFSLIFPVAIYITVTGACAAYIACWGTRYIIQKYIPATEFDWIQLD